MPTVRMIGLVVRPLGRRSEPEVPIQIRRNGRPIRGTTGPPIAFVAPDMNFPNWTDRAVLNELYAALDVAEGMGIGAMLGRYLMFRSQVRHHARLPDRMGEWLFTVDVFPRPQRPRRGDRVGMVGCRNDDRIQVLRLVDHLAEVAVLFSLGKFIGSL